MNPSLDDVFDVEAFERMNRDAAARREMLWLQAMIKGERREARELEALEPKLRRRIAPVVSRHWRAERRARADPKAERELYEAIWDERLDHHIARFAGKACSCPECVR